jgi:trans-aconitate methyltransferase
MDNQPELIHPSLSGLPDRPVERDEALRVTAEELLYIFGVSADDLPCDCLHILNTEDFRYRNLEPTERESTLKDVIERINSDNLWVSGADKQHVWEKGWKENLDEYEQSKNVLSLIPKYLQGKKILRLKRRFIIAYDHKFSFNLADVFRRWVFRKYLGNVKAIYEFGCGSAQHMSALAELFPDKELHGLDWSEASLAILQKLVEDRGWKIKSHRFNLFEPDASLPLNSTCGVFTFGTMEQLGKNFEPFLQFLIKSRPAIVVHVEPISELYDKNNLMDYLAWQYHRKRNYLDGYLDRLRRLESKSIVRIIDTRRAYFGSMYHDSYSLLVWKTIENAANEVSRR